MTQNNCNHKDYINVSANLSPVSLVWSQAVVHLHCNHYFKRQVKEVGNGSKMKKKD